MTTTPLISVAVFGAGRIGHRHARTVASEIRGAKLAAICDVNLEAARELADLTGCDRITNDPAEIFNDSSVQAVIIGTSTDSHASCRPFRGRNDSRCSMP